jgi:hypothetical protein
MEKMAEAAAEAEAKRLNDMLRSLDEARNKRKRTDG